MENRSQAEVGALVKARRLELRITENQLHAATGIDRKTLKALESGERWPQEETRMKVEVELRWMPGSIQTLREGGTATVLPDDGETFEEIPPLRAASNEDLLAEILRRFEEEPSAAGRSAVTADEREHPVPEPFFVRGTGEVPREDRREHGR